MNRRMVLYMLGSVVKIEALLLLLPLITAFIYGETNSVNAFLISIAIALAVGFAMTLLARPGSKVIYAREKFFIVMPSRKNPDGTYRDIVHPINSEFRNDLEEAVIDAYHVQLVASQHDEENEDNAVII